ncbi:F-box/LRR-repeat protein 4-like [Uloborus diversus]|uniref:F-box/LRR-repeat protein 4-like n=1 Tax=Uloborus diversus TaxID=327109 RepID=UPI002409D127|nr:F-box/LRR-repeat protein 4-like [Uloborus diversus]
MKSVEASVEYEEDIILNRLHEESFKKGKHVFSLRAYEVVDFSSQYGAEGSLSYTAPNILGPPCIFPRAGDHAYAYQMRTYGDWWNILPSSRKHFINLPPGCPAESQDFVEFLVEKKVSPIFMRVYEVYNPGAIVKILCYCYETQKWTVLWQGAPQIQNPSKSNCFSIEIESIDFLTDYYRIEFHHRHLNYYFEVDGLILYGEDRFPNPFTNHSLPSTSYLCSKPLVKKVVGDNFSNCTVSCFKASEQEYSGFAFDLLPHEILHTILSYLDLQSLCCTAKVSRVFREVCYDPVLYRDLNLQLYWHLVDESALKNLEPRLNSLRNMNLSWCGGQGRITHPYFIKFLETKCCNLTSLNISCCPFVNNHVLNAISKCCPSLQEFEMKSCHAADLTQSGFRFISEMKNLIYLDLYRTHIDKSSILTIIKGCTKLEHLLLGSCKNISSFNELASAVGKNLPNIKTLDFWRACSLTCIGILELADKCHELVELDIGWCYKIDAACGCIKKLISQCHNLKKLFLTAIR